MFHLQCLLQGQSGVNCGSPTSVVYAQVGPGVKGVNEDNWVIPLRSHMGTWQDLAVMRAADLIVIPQDCMPPECAALSQQLCLAYCLLEQFGKLKVGRNCPTK